MTSHNVFKGFTSKESRFVYEGPETGPTYEFTPKETGASEEGPDTAFTLAETEEFDKEESEKEGAVMKFSPEEGAKLKAQAEADQKKAEEAHEKTIAQAEQKKESFWSNLWPFGKKTSQEQLMEVAAKQEEANSKARLALKAIQMNKEAHGGQIVPTEVAETLEGASTAEIMDAAPDKSDKENLNVFLIAMGVVDKELRDKAIESAMSA
jgi:hypothetical protein